MDPLSFERVNDRLGTLAQIGRALRNALRTRYTVAITPEACEAIYWTMVSIDTSQIDDEVAARLRAANENVAVGRVVEWLRSIDDRPRK